MSKVGRFQQNYSRFAVSCFFAPNLGTHFHEDALEKNQLSDIQEPYEHHKQRLRRKRNHRCSKFPKTTSNCFFRKTSHSHGENFWIICDQICSLLDLALTCKDLDLDLPSLDQDCDSGLPSLGQDLDLDLQGLGQVFAKPRIET